MEGTMLSNIGSAYDALGDKKRALEYYEQALPIRRAVRDPRGIEVTLFNMGLVRIGLGAFESGIADLEEAARISCGVQYPTCPSDITAWYGEARKYGQTVSAERALRLIKQAAGDNLPPAILASLRRLDQPIDLGGQGVFIKEVLPNSNALQSKLAVDDIIVRYNGEPVDDVNGFAERVKATSGDTDPIAVLLIRGDKVVRLMVEPGPLGAFIEAVP